MPPVDLATDIFVAVFRSFCGANKIDFTKSLLKGMKEILGPDVLPPTQRPFVVVDEAQQAAEYLNESTSTGTDKRLFCIRSATFFGTLDSFKGLSMKMVRTVSSQSAQRQDHSQGPVFVEVGQFTMDGTSAIDGASIILVSWTVCTAFNIVSRC